MRFGIWMRAPAASPKPMTRAQTLIRSARRQGTPRLPQRRATFVARSEKAGRWRPSALRIGEGRTRRKQALGNATGNAGNARLAVGRQPVAKVRGIGAGDGNRTHDI